jgi:hypothetical protein
VLLEIDEHQCVAIVRRQAPDQAMELAVRFVAEERGERIGAWVRIRPAVLGQQRAPFGKVGRSLGECRGQLPTNEVARDAEEPRAQIAARGIEIRSARVQVDDRLLRDVGGDARRAGPQVGEAIDGGAVTAVERREGALVAVERGGDERAVGGIRGRAGVGVGHRRHRIVLRIRRGARKSSRDPPTARIPRCAPDRIPATTVIRTRARRSIITIPGTIMRTSIATMHPMRSGGRCSRRARSRWRSPGSRRQAGGGPARSRSCPTPAT